ncbi:dihydroneopterin aldolase [Nitrospira sp. NS4]|uniref:dihydroneopterin aldolase n=1 Tax=Nitrospira sp. NS4 TaxID=3414498 RepID=UPI003C2F2DB8
MPEHIVIERLEFRGRCGVTEEERAKPQPLAVDLKLDCRTGQAGRSDNLAETIDYAAVARRIADIGTTQDACLLEALADRFLSMLFAEFPIDSATLWLRKLHPPIRQVTTSVGVSLTRTRLQHQLQQSEPAPAPFLMQQLHRLPKGRVLDVAAGGGRHALFLAAHGYQVDALDRDGAALTQLSQSAAGRRLSSITTRTMDLEQPAPFDPDFGHERYDGIVVFFYLHRPLFPFLIEALKPGGVVVYETFSIDNHLRHGHPRRQEFCLTRNELLRLTSPLQVLHYDEGAHDGVHGSGSTYTAQLVAQKPARSATPA